MRIFWPRECLAGYGTGAHCIVVGWQNGDDVVVVAALPHLALPLAARVLEEDTLFAQPNRTRSASQLYSRVNDQRLLVLGTVGHFQDGALFRVDIEQQGLSAKDSAGRESVLIVFSPPNPSKMHYLTLRPARLYIPLNSTQSPLWPAMEYHLGHQKPSSQLKDEEKWGRCIAQMNCVFELEPLLKKNAMEVFPELAREPQLLETSYRKTRSRSRALSLGAPVAASIVSKQRLLGFVMTVRYAIEFGLQLIETHWLRGLSLQSISCSAQQIDLRLNQLCFLPLQYMSITHRTQRDWHWLTPDRNETYIRFSNNLWLWINDWILGVYFCYIIRRNAPFLENAVERLIYTVFGSQYIALMEWLMAWPAGFKLNTQLAVFMGEVFMLIIIMWQWVVEKIFRPAAIKAIVNFIAWSGVVSGATLQISLVIDFISITGAHAYLFYQVLARVYDRQLRVLASLFRVFRGKKYNLLRQRVDSGDYDFAELLLGTILFTIFLFLLPTVIAFYLVFAITRTAMLAVVTLLGMVLAFLNYFPLFPLLLRLTSPRRVPSGVRFKRHFNQLELWSQPMRLGEIFRQYTEITRQFVKENLNLELLMGLLTGQVVSVQQSKLYASLYSVLPSNRGSAAFLRTELQNYLGI